MTCPQSHVGAGFPWIICLVPEGTAHWASRPSCFSQKKEDNFSNCLNHRGASTGKHWRASALWVTEEFKMAFLSPCTLTCGLRTGLNPGDHVKSSLGTVDPVCERGCDLMLLLLKGTWH